MGARLSEIVPMAATLLDFLLNIVGLLLWFNWRAASVKSPPPGMVSLAATLQKTESIEPQRWFSLVCLVALLVVRPLLYCQIGTQVNWTASLDLTAFVLPFRSDLLGRIYLFSTLSFAVGLGVLYGALLLLSVVNTRSKEADYFCRLLFMQLGWFGKWPWPLRLLLGPAAAALLWMALQPALVDLGIFPAPRNNAHAWQIAGLLAMAMVISWKYVIGLFLGLHLLNSYVYLGNSSFWKFVALTGERLSLPLRWLPLRIGKVDFAPALILVGVIWGAHAASVWLPNFYQQLPL